MKKKLISSLLAISMIATAIQPQVIFAEGTEIESEQELLSEEVTETEVSNDTSVNVPYMTENTTEEIAETEIEEEITDEEQPLTEEATAEEQILDESEETLPVQTYEEEQDAENEESFLYTVLDDGTAEITGYQGEEKGDLIIPDSIDGYVVTSIGIQAFSWKKFAGKLRLPSGLKMIKERAFSYSGFSGDLVIPDSVIEIGESAFSGDGFNGTLRLPSNLTKLEDYVFYGCDFTGNLDLPINLTQIGEYAFGGCLFTGTLNLPDGLTKINPGSFGSCKFKGDLLIPADVTEIGEAAFYACDFDGSLTLPSKLEKIGDDAFANCKFTGDIALPSNLTYVGKGAFQNAHVRDIFGEFNALCGMAAINNNVFGNDNWNAYSVRCGTQIGIGQTREAKILINGMILDQQFVTKWSSSDSNIATINTEGVIEAKKSGKVSIKAELFNGVSCETTLEVEKDPVEYTEEKYEIFMSPKADKFDDLWVGDEIYIGTDRDEWKGENQSIDSIKVITGESLVSVIESGNAWKIVCDSLGTAVIRISFKNNKIPPVDYKLNIGIRKNEVKIEVDKESLKLGGSIKSNLYNLPYGTDPFVYVNDEDAKNFMINRLDGGGYGGPTTYFKREDKGISGVHYKMELDSGELFYRCVWNVTYPGYVKLSYYRNWEEAANGYPMASCSVKIEEPILKQNLKSEYMIGDEQELQFYLDNTNYKDIYLSNEENKEYVEEGQFRYPLYYIPKLEVISGKDCVEFTSDKKLSTLSLKQQVRFIKAGTVKFKITYEPSGINASVNKIYKPEKIITVQVDAQNATATFDSAGGSNVSSQTVAIGNRLVEPKDPVRSGYTFLGWYVGGKKYDFMQPLENDITLVAKWQKQQISVTGITLDKNTLGLKKKQTAQLKATVKPIDATNKSLKWETSNPKVATVKDGKVTAIGNGKAVITATALDGSKQKATCNVTVGYMIDYKLNGGKNDKNNPQSYYNEVIKLKNPTRKGYTFAGWFADKKLKKQVKQISKKDRTDLVLYAKWEKVKVANAKFTSVTRKNADRMTVKYAAVSKAKGYEITYATDKKFKKNCKVVTSKSRSVTLKKLQTKKTYYVKVRAYKLDSTGKKVYGKYSSVKTVKFSKTQK